MVTIQGVERHRVTGAAQEAGVSMCLSEGLGQLSDGAGTGLALRRGQTWCWRPGGRVGEESRREMVRPGLGVWGSERSKNQQGLVMRKWRRREKIMINTYWAQWVCGSVASVSYLPLHLIVTTS